MAKFLKATDLKKSIIIFTLNAYLSSKNELSKDRNDPSENFST
jgi:hypothetical protein